MKMYEFELMQKRNMKKFTPAQQKFLCTMIVNDAKNADESGRKEKDGFKYDIEKINKERKEMTPIIKE